MTETITETMTGWAVMAKDRLTGAESIKWYSGQAMLFRRKNMAVNYQRHLRKIGVRSRVVKAAMTLTTEI